MRESLENVKVGDKVVVHRRSGDVIGTVHRVTQTMIMVGNNRFKKKNGDMVGGSSEYWFCYITIPEDGEVEMVKKKMFVSDIANDAIKKDKQRLSYELRKKSWRGEPKRTIYKGLNSRKRRRNQLYFNRLVEDQK